MNNGKLAKRVSGPLVAGRWCSRVVVDGLVAGVVLVGVVVKTRSPQGHVDFPCAMIDAVAGNGRQRIQSKK